jgi:ComF family protein
MDAEPVLCIYCKSLIPQTNYHHISDNETALRFAGRIPFQNASSFAYFTKDGLLQHLLHALKYQGKKEIGIFLGRQFGYALQGIPWTNTIDLILPVPLYIKRYKERGFNQSKLLAQGLQEILTIPIDATILQRVRNTESQTLKTREDRANNMKDAFVVAKGELLKNKHVLLIDDVLTTGATLEACANVLVPVSGIQISIATIGIASSS